MSTATKNPLLTIEEENFLSDWNGGKLSNGQKAFWYHELPFHIEESRDESMEILQNLRDEFETIENAQEESVGQNHYDYLEQPELLTGIYTESDSQKVEKAEKVIREVSADHTVKEINDMLRRKGRKGWSHLKKAEKIEYIITGKLPRPAPKPKTHGMNAEQKATYYRSKDKNSAMYLKQECRDRGVKGWSHLKKDQLIAVRAAGFTEEAIKAFPKKAPNYGTVADMRKWISANRNKGVDITAESKRWSGGDTVSKFKAAQLREFVAHLETLGLKY